MFAAAQRTYSSVTGGRPGLVGVAKHRADCHVIRPGIAGALGLLRCVGAQAKLERCADWLHLVDVPVADIEKSSCPRCAVGALTSAAIPG